MHKCIHAWVYYIHIIYIHIYIYNCVRILKVIFLSSDNSCGRMQFCGWMVRQSECQRAILNEEWRVKTTAWHPDRLDRQTLITPEFSLQVTNNITMYRARTQPSQRVVSLPENVTFLLYISFPRLNTVIVTRDKLLSIQHCHVPSTGMLAFSSVLTLKNLTSRSVPFKVTVMQWASSFLIFKTAKKEFWKITSAAINTYSFHWRQAIAMGKFDRNIGWQIKCYNNLMISYRPIDLNDQMDWPTTASPVV